MVQRERARDAQREIFSDAPDLTTDDEARLPGLHKKMADKITNKNRVTTFWVCHIILIKKRLSEKTMNTLSVFYPSSQTLLFGNKTNGNSKG